MKKYFLYSILAIASIFHSTLPIEALAASSEQFSRGPSPIDEAQAVRIWQGSITLEKQSAKSTAVVASDQSNSGRGLEEPRHDTIRQSTGKTTEKHLQDLVMGASTGTAWPISSGYVVTNNHVVSKGSKVVLISAQGREIPASDRAL